MMAYTVNNETNDQHLSLISTVLRSLKPKPVINGTHYLARARKPNTNKLRERERERD